MVCSVYDLRNFYHSFTGHVVQTVIQDVLDEYWPNGEGQDVLGCGYALSYLKETHFAHLPASLGIHHWPLEQEKNRAVLSEDSELPFGNSSMDRILFIHGLEYSELPSQALEEVWRVLKPNGRLFVVVPSRSGFWAHHEKSPLGHGKPYSLKQIGHLLRDNRFVEERSADALYIPPMKSKLWMKTYRIWEILGRYVPLPPGVHIVEASKQLYGGVGKGSGARVRIRGRDIFGEPEPVASGYIKSH